MSSAESVALVLVAAAALATAHVTVATLTEGSSSKAQHRSDVETDLIEISWDLGGQPRFRSMWERYCRGVNAIVFIVDSADKEALPVAKEELHILLDKQTMEGIPLLVLGNKSDIAGHATVDELIDQLSLKQVTHREVSCYGISAKEETNLDAVLNWLIKRAGK